MSNTSVGGVYAQIMAEVIDSSRIDFEEMGVEESVLEELKKVSPRLPILSSLSYSALHFHHGPLGLLRTSEALACWKHKIVHPRLIFCSLLA